MFRNEAASAAGAEAEAAASGSRAGGRDGPTFTYVRAVCMRSSEIKFFSSSESPAAAVNQPASQPRQPRQPRTRIQLDFLARGSSCRLFSPTPLPSSPLSRSRSPLASPPPAERDRHPFSSSLSPFRFCSRSCALRPAEQRLVAEHRSEDDDRGIGTRAFPKRKSSTYPGLARRSIGRSLNRGLHEFAACARVSGIRCYQRSVYLLFRVTELRRKKHGVDCIIIK